MCGDPRRQAQSQKPGALLTYEERVKKAEALTVNKCERCQPLPLLLKLITRKCKQKAKRGSPPPPSAPVMVPQGLGTLF